MHENTTTENAPTHENGPKSWDPFYAGVGKLAVMLLVVVGIHWLYTQASAAYSQFFPTCVVLDMEDGSRSTGWLARSLSGNLLFQDRPGHWHMPRRPSAFAVSVDGRSIVCDTPYSRPRGAGIL